MTSSPSRNPAFLIVSLLALGSTIAAHIHDPIKTRVVEQIEARYMSDRTACLALEGAAKAECEALAELRQTIALGELNKLLHEGDDGLARSDNVALGTGPSRW